MIETRNGAIINGESERYSRRKVESYRQRGADRGRMSNNDDIASLIPLGQLRNGWPYPVDKILETFASLRALVRRRKPDAMARAATALLQDLLSGQTLPATQVLLRESFFPYELRL